VTNDRGVGLKGWLSGPKSKDAKAEARAEKLVPLDKHRIVVLPMTNISPDPQDEYFAEGMTDELISTISKIRDLHVVARTSSMKYKGSGKGVSEISQELRTGSILEGTVRKAGHQLRVTAQLIDSQTEESLWSESYDRELGDVFAIQSDIARNVSEGLKVHLTRVGHAQRKPTESSDAYAHYLKGRYFLNKGTPDWFNKARTEFELAIKKDPAFALGYSGLADTHLLLGRQGHTPPKIAYPEAIRFATKAISLDETLAEPHVALAAIRQEYEWKWDESERGFKRAIELNPSNATAHAWYALYLGHIGRFDQAIDEAKRGIELDPLSPRTHVAASEEYLFAHQFDKAIEEAETMMEVVPEFGGAFGYRAYAEVEKGMFDQAIADFQEAGKRQGGRAWAGRLGHAYGASGRRTEATKILQELETQPVQGPPKNPFLPPPPDTALDIALVHLGLGNSLVAIGWLEKACDERTAEIIHLKCEPIYKNIQREARVRALLKRIGLER
jgi:adenylate cyclase